MKSTLVLETVPCCVCGSHEARPMARGPDYEYASCDNDFTFVACEGCGHCYLTPRPAIGDLGVIYPPNYYSYAEDEGQRGGLTQFAWDRLERRKIAGFRALVGDNASAHVFELGCGSGRLLRLLRRYLPAAWTVSGVEIDEAAAARADDIEGVTAQRGFFEELSIPEGSLDLIIAQQVIEHVPDPRRILEKAAASLAPGGVLVLETPNVEGLDRRVFSGSYWGGYHFPRHFNLFSPRSLGRLAQEAGFVRTGVNPLLSVTFWITTMRNILARHGRLPWGLGWIHIRNPLLLGLTTSLELSLRILGVSSSNMQFIAHR